MPTVLQLGSFNYFRVCNVFTGLWLLQRVCSVYDMRKAGRWPVFLAMVWLVATAAAINRSVYKVILNQKGFTQFIQYDVETPPIREFTFCTWLKAYNFQNEQSIFTYIVKGNKRVVRLWVDSGGRHVRVVFNEREVGGAPADLGAGVWRHLCLSYQADFGAWALYLDARLLSCEASQALQFFVIPGGGSVILGYGTTEEGGPTGLEGEIFGANMILTSTIGRNYSIQNHPQYLQKPFNQNKIQTSKNIDYVVLSNLDTEESPNIAKEIKLPKFNTTNSFIKVQTPYSFIEHAIGLQHTSVKPTKIYGSSASHESEILDIVMNQNSRPRLNSARNSWNNRGQDISTPSFKVHNQRGNEQTHSDTNDFPMLSEYETPPLPHSERTDYHTDKNKSFPESIFKVTAQTTNPNKNEYTQKSHQYDLSEIEVPPPREMGAKVYGQWTSSKYAGSVLNYLKSINYYNKDKKVPNTIPLIKVSDNYPYASNLNTRVVRPPTNLQKKIIHEMRFQDHYQPESGKYRHVQKREVKMPQINVKVIEEDIRTEILKSHASTKPRHVEIINRGDSQRRLIRNSDSMRLERDEYRSNENNLYQSSNDLPGSSSMFNVLPFLKSIEYFTGESETLVKASDDMYSKSFSAPNKWHNIKTYNNDYTPRRVLALDNYNNELDQKASEANKKHPSILLKYKPDTNKIIQQYNEESMIKGRLMAKDVSNQSENNNEKVSILKYNHGFLPGHTETVKNTKSLLRDAELRSKAEFHKHVKIGNALNERKVIGNNEEQKKQSFIGGDETIPDINRYRSDIDHEKHNVPPSLRPKVCRNVELLDHLLYVHPDGSIKMSRIVSPIQTKNIALEFVILNYKKCSLTDSPLESNNLLLIDWSNTPVRLFGGAVAIKTKDLCGFF